jgi:hypothetical protein
VKLDIENIRGVNLAAIKFSTVHVTKPRGRICFAKPGLTEDLNFSHMRCVHLTRAKPILLPKRILHKDYDHKGSVAKQISLCDSEGAWKKDELTGGELEVVK